MNKIRYQTMFDYDNYRDLITISKKMGHRSLSETINEVVSSYFKLLEKMSEQTQEKPIVEPKKKKSINSVIDDLNKKYGIE